MKHLKKRSNRTYREACFARINWNAHFVPIAKATHAEFSLQVKKLDLSPPYIRVLSELVGVVQFAESQKDIWTDSASFHFGHSPVPGLPVVPAQGGTRSLVEQGAHLDFVQAISGGVAALLYPPTSPDVVEPLKPFYIVDWWGNPSDVDAGQIIKLLVLALETNLFCGVANYPNSKGQRIMAKLEAKDSVIANGGSRIWVWLKYVIRASNSALRFYGIGSPVPR